MSVADRTFCIAPMLNRTDRHYRYFARLLTKRALLYTEMVTTGAILKGDTLCRLQYNREEHPVALQLGGNDPKELQECAHIAADYGYDEINLNVGCPSDRAQNGTFGACLMAKPELVAECINAMQQAVDIPVTVKHRIGIDNLDSSEALMKFSTTVAGTGCKTFIVHARKAWLRGLSPKENREIPPLQYEKVYQLKNDCPDLEIIINGGIRTLDECHQLLHHVDGVMVGREAYNNAYMLSEVDQQFHGCNHEQISRREVLERLIPYIHEEVSNGTGLHQIIRHISGLFQGIPGARTWRRQLSTNQKLTVQQFTELARTLYL